jgi:shikimate kinase
MNEETRALILAETNAVWIDADIDVLVERVKRRDHRPLLAGKDQASVLRDLAKQRNPVYALAPIHVRSQTTPHDATVDSILKAIG